MSERRARGELLRRRGRTIALVLAAALLATSVTGCGGDDGDDEGATASTTSAPAATTTTEPGAASGGATVIAHRGASGHAPEHTFAAYDLALDQGADYIEQDLQMSADGVLVVLHDDTLDRTARGPADSCTGPVATKTLDELRRCDMGSWFNDAHPDLADPAFVGLRIPTMEEVLERYGPDVHYYIETKSPDAQPGMEQALLALLDAAGVAGPDVEPGQVIIQSFSPASLELVHSLRPEIPLVQLLPRVASPVEVTLLDPIREYATGIGPSAQNVDAALVDEAHLRCLDVHPYTVDDPAEMARLLEAGVDGMFTNAPDLMIEERARHPEPAGHCVE